MKREKQEIGDLCFWNEIVVYYRNERNQAAKSGSCQDVINFTELLKESWQELKRVEGIILRGAAVVIVLVAMLVCQGCMTAKGITGDSGWFLTKLSENIQSQEK